MRYSFWSILACLWAPLGFALPNFMVPEMPKPVREVRQERAVEIPEVVLGGALYSAPEAKNRGYVLGSGDNIRLTVYGEEDLSGEYEVDGSGRVSLPLVGSVLAGGLTVPQLEKVLVGKFSAGYLKNPRLSVDVLNFRPFYIMGEVNNPGNYPYINGLTVLSAVAVAGGYTPRAKKRGMRVTRKQQGGVVVLDAEEATAVKPGDTIEIRERFF